MATKGKGPKSDTGRPVLEWIMGALGLALTLAAVGLVLRDAHSRPSPPSLEVRMVEARPMGDQWVAEVEVSNRGDATAASVAVEGGTAPDVASATLDYAPGHGRERLSLVLPARPGPDTPFRIRGWSEP
ncbi:hypothetical protein [Brevundimonas sp. A19_0]|uniref:hypothetical protein n=1 Tax=Brevundimonas sp. A19_0 TaxID=2821087 RepID=UPI001ADC0807|nr:hypothetical protein [Brevundimonas sp. A19_0]MBO9501992.1 hypothetical protein [Brevundimonas sp. A19_0]